MRPNVMTLAPPAANPRLQPIATARQSPFFCMVLNRAWDDVLRRSRTRPQELDLQDDSTGNTLLHEACRLDPPPDVIRALQATCRVKNHQGATPLHLAASHRCSAEALRVLLDCAASTPRSETDDTSPTADLSNAGRSPMHYACMSFRGLEIDAFLLLLDETLKHGNLWLDNRLGLEDDFAIEEEGYDEELDDYYPAPQVTESKDEKTFVNVMSMKDASGMTPLALLFRRYRQRVRSVISTVDRMREESADSDRAALASAMTVHAELGELWEKARRIIARLTEERLSREGTKLEELEPPIRSPGEAAVSSEAARWAMEQHKGSEPGEDDVLPVYVGAVDRDSSVSPAGGSSSKRRQFRIVHASVGLIGYGCPPEMIRLAISIHPHQVREMDEDGNLPLHIAVKASSYLSNADMSLSAAAAAVTEATSDEMSVISDAMSFFSSATISQTSNPFDKVIKILLQHYPEGARIPQGETGQLPLTLAIESGLRTWDDGIRTLLNAYPPALHNKKLIDPSLYPIVLALVTSGSAELVCGSGLFDHVFAPRSSKKRRQDACGRTTLFELLRAKPEWLTPEGRASEIRRPRRRRFPFLR